MCILDIVIPVIISCAKKRSEHLKKFLIIFRPIFLSQDFCTYFDFIKKLKIFKVILLFLHISKPKNIGVRNNKHVKFQIV